MSGVPDFKAFMSRSEKLVCPACMRSHAGVDGKWKSLPSYVYCENCGHLFAAINDTDARALTPSEIAHIRKSNDLNGGAHRKAQERIVARLIG